MTRDYPQPCRLSQRPVTTREKQHDYGCPDWVKSRGVLGGPEVKRLSGEIGQLCLKVMLTDLVR